MCSNMARHMSVCAVSDEKKQSLLLSLNRLRFDAVSNFTKFIMLIAFALKYAGKCLTPNCYYD